MDIPSRDTGLTSEPDMLRRLDTALRETDFGWTLCLIGEDQAGKLAQLAGDLLAAPSPDANGKQFASGFSYWGIEPTIAWARACTDPMYPVMKHSIESFVPRWNSICDGIGDGPVHYVSFGPGTGYKDNAILRSLRRTVGVRSYIPVDISAEMLRMAVHEPIRDLTIPRDLIMPVQLDFVDRHNLRQLQVLLAGLTRDEPVLFSLLGNTLANVPEDATFLSMLAELVRPQDRFALEIATTGAPTKRLAELAAQEYSRSAA